MFTGLITAIGTITAARMHNGAARLTIASPYADLVVGESIACHGVCLTVSASDETTFDVVLSPETLRCTAADVWIPGGRLNLERALRVGDRLGGHFVTGHVDALAELSACAPQGDCLALTVEVPASLSGAIVPKGSVALNGVSLTVNTVEGTRFHAMLIPHTLIHTTFHTLAAPTQLHLEIDLLARYLDRLRHAPLYPELP